MPRRRKSKRLLQAEDKFKAAVTEYLVGLGARPRPPGLCYSYELDTPAGLLLISVYENWVAACFDDVERAKVATKGCGYSCNPYSGKWNFHFGGDNPQSLALETVMPQLDYHFDRLMHWDACSA